MITGFDMWMLGKLKDKREKPWIPTFVTYKTRVKNGFAGYCRYFFFFNYIAIHEKYKHDEVQPTLAHEMCHAAQSSMFPIVFGYLLWFDKWVLLFEADAYRHSVSMRKYTDKSHYDWIVRSLKNRYKLKYSVEHIQSVCDYAFKDELHGNYTQG
jgi:hypothetical protein